VRRIRLLFEARKTECGARTFKKPIFERAAPFALCSALFVLGAAGISRLAAQPPLPPPPELDRLVDRIGTSICMDRLWRKPSMRII
jgi:hypothetical protein